MINYCSRDTRNIRGGSSLDQVCNQSSYYAQIDARYSNLPRRNEGDDSRHVFHVYEDRGKRDAFEALLIDVYLPADVRYIAVRNHARSGPAITIIHSRRRSSRRNIRLFRSPFITARWRCNASCKTSGNHFVKPRFTRVFSCMLRVTIFRWACI